MKTIQLFCLGFLGLILSCTTVQNNAEPKKTAFSTIQKDQIIPVPQKVEYEMGAFVFLPETKIYISNENQRYVAELIQAKFQPAMGYELPIVTQKPKTNFIGFEEDTHLKPGNYKLKVNSNFIELKASDRAGFVYAYESLRQLLPPEIESGNLIKKQWAVQAQNITDFPEFKWRGVMLDVSRHFFSKDYILSTIDRLALLKMNTLHLHLIDDQGWRIEIKKYPKLTEVGAWRADHEDKHWDARPPQKPGEKATYGGFYTQEELKEIVAYATERGINVVPEIEMPAHVTSAIAAYPEYSCQGKPVTVPTGGLWPITDIYCAGQEKTFKFLEDVLDEVMEIFPSEYIHIGGDEATKTNWKTCPHCQERMREEGLKDEKELQSYFIKRIEKYLNQHGRKLVGWDEILEGGIAPEATVMSWRGFDGGIEAANQGHDVVMTPGDYAYFDAYQGTPQNEPLAIGGYKTLSKVYEFNPIPPQIAPDKKHHILGAQANLWAEFVPNEKHSEYMLYPRLFAMSEVLWSSPKQRDIKDFFSRVYVMMDRFDRLGINYAKSIYEVTGKEKIDEKDPNVIWLTLSNEIPTAMDIRYTIDDKNLAKNAKKYTSPIKITKNCTVRASLFKDGKPINNVYEKTFKFHKAVGATVSYEPMYHKSYQGQHETNMVNLLRGTEDFHDGQWQAWLRDNATITLDLHQPIDMSEVVVGMMQKQSSGIYFPLDVVAYVSLDGKNFKKVGEIKQPYEENGFAELKDYVFTFKQQKAQFVKIFIKNIAHPPKGGDAWIFVDEIMVN